VRPPSSTTSIPGVTTGTEPLSEEDRENIANSDVLAVDELELLDRYLAAQRRLSQSKLELQKINNELLATQQELYGSIDTVRDTFHQLAETEAKLATAQANLDAHQARLESAAINTYVSGGRGNAAMAALLRSHTIDDLTKGRVYADAVVEDEQGEIDKYAELRDYIADLKQRADLQKAAAMSARDARVAREDEVNRKRDLQVAAQQSAQDALTQEAAVLAEVAAKKPGALAAYNQRATVSTSGVSGLLARAGATDGPPPDYLALAGYFQHPLPQARLTQRFGPRVHPIFGYSHTHSGLDLAIGTGTPITAAEGGVVVASEWLGGYGNAVVIYHGNRVGTLYGHMVKTGVAVGQFVQRGEVIGFVGSTGYSTGPHLHWEVRLDGTPVDPLPTIGG
jgi:murein DD-endopeptidase MepM/ murein hydrolase activator NlpD